MSADLGAVRSCAWVMRGYWYPRTRWSAGCLRTSCSPGSTKAAGGIVNLRSNGCSPRATTPRPSLPGIGERCPSAGQDLLDGADDLSALRLAAGLESDDHLAAGADRTSGLLLCDFLLTAQHAVCFLSGSKFSQ